MTTEPEKLDDTVSKESTNSNDSAGDNAQESNENKQSSVAVNEIPSSGPPKRKILIGSQLGDDELAVAKPKSPATTTEETTESSSASLPSTPPEIQSVPPSPTQPSKTPASPVAAVDEDDLVTQPVQKEKVKYEIPSRQNVDDEIDRMLSGVSMDDLMGDQPLVEELELESVTKATVDKIHNENIFFNLKGRFVGVASTRNFKELPEPGAMMDVVIRSFNREDGLYEVSVPGTSVDVADWSDLVVGGIVEVKITGSNTGGLEGTVNNIRGFIPASQIEIFRVENFGDYVNRKLPCVVTEVNPHKKKLVLSHRAIAEREREEQKKILLETLQTGETREGTVTKLMDFGAFVDIGGVEGLIHISKLAWDRVTHPREILKEGERVSVKVDKINQQTGKIGLSYRDTQEHPWKKVDEKYPVNSTVTGTVSKLAQFGAFVKLEPGIEGLIHISEIAHHRVLAVKTHLNVGDEVSVKILSVDPQSQKIGLSIKALLDKPEQPESKKEQEVEEPLRESAVPKSDEPLKGGTSRRGGGENFGLNW